MKRNHRSGGYFTKSRGAFDYIATYSDAAWKLYDWILGHSRWDVAPSNPHYGTVQFQISDVARQMGHHTQTIKRSLRELHFGYPESDPPAPPFIRIIAVSGNTRSQVITAKLLKPKLRPSDFKNRTQRPESPGIPKTTDPELKRYLKRLADGIRRQRKLPDVNNGK